MENFSRSHCLLADRGTIIAIVAYIPSADLTAKLNSVGLQESVRRLNSLEQRLSSLDKKARSAFLHQCRRILPQRRRLGQPPYNRLSRLLSYLRLVLKPNLEKTCAPHRSRNQSMPHPQTVAPDHLENLNRRSLAQSHRHTRRIHWHFILPEVRLRQ